MGLREESDSFCIYKLSNILHQILAVNNKSIQNATELIELIKNIQIKENQTIISFDLQHLYTNIPIDGTINIIWKNLTEQNNRVQLIIDEITQLLHTWYSNKTIMNIKGNIIHNKKELP